ncbi:NADH-quinone oxidoreductase subunit NuoE [Polymorphobacter sp.]|uniref:NADH-quinone oxidoreductase subunit NuoE n=1 Tax=Polymorphobacter sp. TaxID=1909290 RepID=UPI003F720E0B
MSLPDALAAGIRHAVDSHGGPRGAILEALRLVQQAEGWVSDARIADIATLLGMTTAEIDNIATFYSHIFRRKVGRRLIMLCDGASCYLNGADAVRDAVMARLGIGFGETTPDGDYTLLNVCCVGDCDHAPAGVLGRDRQPARRLSPEAIDTLLDGPE